MKSLREYAQARVALRLRILLLLRAAGPRLLVPTVALQVFTGLAPLFERYAESARAVARATGGIAVFVSHRFSTVRMADLIVVLDDGRVAERGSHEELVAQGGIYAELFALQAAAYG